VSRRSSSGRRPRRIVSQSAAEPIETREEPRGAEHRARGAAANASRGGDRLQHDQADSGYARLLRRRASGDGRAPRSFAGRGTRPELERSVAGRGLEEVVPAAVSPAPLPCVGFVRLTAGLLGPRAAPARTPGPPAPEAPARPPRRARGRLRVAVDPRSRASGPCPGQGSGTTTVPPLPSPRRGPPRGTGTRARRTEVRAELSAAPRAGAPSASTKSP
jgi:hypothetical protein